MVRIQERGCDIILIDKVQKQQEIKDEAINKLRKKKLIEGRKPKFFISKEIAEILDEKAEYTLNKGLDTEILQSFILKHIDTHGFATRKEIETLLLNKLPDYLTEKQKKKKITNMIQDLKNEIENIGIRSKPKWVRIKK